MFWYQKIEKKSLVLTIYEYLDHFEMHIKNICVHWNQSLGGDYMCISFFNDTSNYGSSILVRHGWK